VCIHLGRQNDGSGIFIYDRGPYSRQNVINTVIAVGFKLTVKLLGIVCDEHVVGSFWRARYHLEVMQTLGRMSRKIFRLLEA